jgi:hypothetical protein
MGFYFEKNYAPFLSASFFSSCTTLSSFEYKNTLYRLLDLLKGGIREGLDDPLPAL